MRFGIYNGDDCAIGGCIVSLKGKARLFPAAPENQLANTGANGINGYHRFTSSCEIFIERLNYKQLSPFQRFVLYRRHNRPDDASKLHKVGVPSIVNRKS